MIQESQGTIPLREAECLASSDVGVVMLRRLWRESMDAVARGEPAKALITDADGVLEVDTFKGLAKADDIVLGPVNMPSSKDGRGLIRDEQGNLVFA